MVLFRSVVVLSLFVVAGCVTPDAYGNYDASSGAYAGGPAQPECRMGSDGRQACGYHCMMGSDGVVACANSPDGVCAMGSDGEVTCSQLAAGAGAQLVNAPPECKLNSDGTNTCGYHCRLGSSGYWFCASSPNGVCALNSNGTWTCT